MLQFAVYLNKNLRGRASFPMLVDVQSELLQDLQTRVVVPLIKRAAFTGFPLGLLMPTIQVEDEPYVFMAPQIAGVSLEDLGPQTGSAAAHSRAISTAMDILLRGF
jgi:toxin CcdB